MLGMKRRPKRSKGPDQVGIAPIPLGGYDVAGTAAGVPMWAPVEAIPSWYQIGRYGTPIPTLQGGYWPDVQQFCGVEGIERRYMVLTAADVPYFQQTAYPVDPQRNLLDGRRPGNPLGLAGVATLLGPGRKSRLQQQQALASDIAGW